MLASAIWATSTTWIVVWIVLGITLAFACDRIGASHTERLMRERRRHAERTARTMRRMTKIRRQTVARMERASKGSRR